MARHAHSGLQYKRLVWYGMVTLCRELPPNVVLDKSQ